MNDVELVQHAIDSLDTGLPERPDLDLVRSAGARQRRRRRLGWTAGACAAVGVLVVPAVLLAGPGGTGPTVAPDPAGDPGHVVAPAPPAVAPGELAGPEFGTGMRAAVEQAVPGATFRSEELADGWRFSAEHDSYEWTVGNPVGWETLFAWSQHFTLPDGGDLSVVASRTSLEGYLGGPGPTECKQAQYPSRRSCEATDVGAQRVMVNDGVQFDDPTRWFRNVDVLYFDETRGTTAHVLVGVWTDAPTWAQARDELPSADDLTTLGLQAALKLPAPDHYPVPDDLEEHNSSTP
jgi:hypothetical protein